MSVKPLFVPLRGEWFDAFARGEKTIEWRVYGPRWNERHIYPGRRVVLSRGYSGARLTGTVAQMQRVPASEGPAGIETIYPNAEEFAAIHVVLDGANS